MLLLIIPVLYDNKDMVQLSDDAQVWPHTRERHADFRDNLLTKHPSQLHLVHTEHDVLRH